MTSEPTVPKESAIVEVSPETNALVETQMAGEKDEIKQETKELIEAVKRLAQSEMQSAGEFTRDAYIKAVRQARETIERIKLIDSERFEKSFQMLETETDKNWQSVVKEMADFGDRLVAAAKAAWEVLTTPRPSDSDRNPKE